MGLQVTQISTIEGEDVTYNSDYIHVGSVTVITAVVFDDDDRPNHVILFFGFAVVIVVGGEYGPWVRATSQKKHVNPFSEIAGEVGTKVTVSAGAVVTVAKVDIPEESDSRQQNIKCLFADDKEKLILAGINRKETLVPGENTAVVMLFEGFEELVGVVERHKPMVEKVADGARKKSAMDIFPIGEPNAIVVDAVVVIQHVRVVDGRHVVSV